MLLFNRRVRELLLIGESERPAVAWLFGFSLLAGIPQIATMTAASALLVEQLAPEALPWLMLANGAGVSLPAAAMILLLRDRSAGTRISVTCLFLVAGSVVLSILSVLLGPAPVTAVLFYFSSRVENVFLAVAFLISANAQFSPRAGRRVLGFASTGQVVTLIAGGALIPLALRYFTAEKLIFVSLAAHLALFFHSRSLSGPAASASAPDGSSATVSVGGRSNRAAESDQRRLSLGVFAAIGLMYVLYFLVDTAFLGGLNRSLGPGSGADLDVGAFVARFWVVVGLVALVTKLLFTGRFLHRFGLIGGMLAGPLVLGVLFAAALILGGVGGWAGTALSPLVIVVVLKGVERVVDGSLFLPGYYGLFQAFRPRLQARNQMLAESVIGHGAASVAGFALVLTRLSESFSLVTIYALGLGLAAVWLVGSLLAVRSYHRAMARFLSPPIRKTWPRGVPVPPRAGDAPRPALEPGGDVTRPAGAAAMPGIEERLAFARALLDRLRERPDEWPPLVEALENEWNTNLDIIAGLIDSRMQSRRLSDRLSRLRGLSGRDFGLAIDAVAPLIPPVYREPMLALLERDEPFLLDRATRGLVTPASARPAGARSLDLSSAGRWTQEVLDLSRLPDRDCEWQDRYRDMLHLKASDLFRFFPHELLFELSRGTTRERFSGGQDIVAEGDRGESMFVITRGSVVVMKGPRLLATLATGSCVGELAALLPEQRSATVTACEPVEALVLDRAGLLTFLRRQPAAVRTLQSILMERILTRLSAWASGRRQDAPQGPTVTQARSVEAAPRQSFRLLDPQGTFADLHPERLADLSVNVSYRELAPGEATGVPDTSESQLWMLVSGRAGESVGGLPLVDHVAGGVAGVLPWLGYRAAATHLEVDPGASQAARFAVIDGAVYEALLSDSPAFQIAVLNTLVTMSRSLVRLVR